MFPTHPARPRAVCTCRSWWCPAVSTAPAEGRPWTVLWSVLTSSLHWSHASSTSPSPRGAERKRTGRTVTYAPAHTHVVYTNTCQRKTVNTQTHTYTQDNTVKSRISSWFFCIVNMRKCENWILKNITKIWVKIGFYKHYFQCNHTTLSLRWALGKTSSSVSSLFSPRFLEPQDFQSCPNRKRSPLIVNYGGQQLLATGKSNRFGGSSKTALKQKCSR